MAKLSFMLLGLAQTLAPLNGFNSQQMVPLHRHSGTFTPNNAPTNILLSNDSYMEGSTSGHVIGQFSTTDADLGDTHTYALVPGTGSNHNASFTIVGNQLRVQTGLTFSGSPYSIRVRSTDAAGDDFEKQFQDNCYTRESRPNEHPPFERFVYGRINQRSRHWSILDHRCGPW